MKKILCSAIVLAAITVGAVAVAANGKCSPCQMAKSIKDAAAQSIKDAQMAALSVGQPYSRDAILEKCPCQRTTKDQTAENLDDVDPTQTVAACCEFCAQPGSLGCQGINSARCNTCQQGLIKMSLAEAAAMVLDAIAAAKENELDVIPEISRAPREELTDPCCPQTVCDEPCKLNEQLQALRCCCAVVAKRLECQGRDAQKCCKKLKNKIDDVEELVEDSIDQSADCCSLTESLLLSIIDQSSDCCSLTENLLISIIDQSTDCCSLTESLLISIIDQSADCCSITETVLGDPLGSTAVLINPCDISLIDVVNGTDADVIAWLKGVYILLANIFQCTCGCGG